jgi:hypothetical protein
VPICVDQTSDDGERIRRSMPQRREAPRANCNAACSTGPNATGMEENHESPGELRAKLWKRFLLHSWTGGGLQGSFDGRGSLEDLEVMKT